MKYLLLIYENEKRFENGYDPKEMAEYGAFGKEFGKAILNGHALKPIHDWVKNYERTWSERFQALDTVLEELVLQELEQEEQGDDSGE